MSKKVDLHQYVQLLRERGILKCKMSPYLDSLSLYVCDGAVYKIMIIAYKVAKKAGINCTHIMIKENLPENILISPSEVNIDKGLYIVQYVYKTRQFNCFPGEKKKIL